MNCFNGLGMHLGNLSLLSKAQSRSICPENPTGEKGKGAMAIDPDFIPSKGLGQGWKVKPFITIPAGETIVLADIDGPGAIQQIWMTPTGPRRNLILRIYWDGQKNPSVESPLGDFFCNGWGNCGEDNSFSQISSLPVCVNPGSAYNCYWEMPFRKHCCITVTNTAQTKLSEQKNTGDAKLYYQINYALTEVPENVAYFHAQFRRTNPLPFKEVYRVLDGVSGKGHYVGTYMAWGVNNNGWWGEGEMKFYMDGDDQFPTICGTGVEDYFGGSYGFISKENGRDDYKDYTTPYTGFHKVRYGADQMFQCQSRFSMYRWHIPDPIRFEKDLRITCQALSWRKDGRYLPLQDDIASVAFWYQTLPTAPFPALPDADYLEVV
jgi:hypothetical protein